MADSSTPLIQLKGLRRVYQMGETTVRALDGVDYTIERGEFIMLMGSSGSGKSTMMHILGCLDRPDKARFSLRGRMSRTGTISTVRPCATTASVLCFNSFISSDI